MSSVIELYRDVNIGSIFDLSIFVKNTGSDSYDAAVGCSTYSAIGVVDKFISFFSSDLRRLKRQSEWSTLSVGFWGSPRWFWHSWLIQDDSSLFLLRWLRLNPLLISYTCRRSVNLHCHSTSLLITTIVDDIADGCLISYLRASNTLQRRNPEFVLRGFFDGGYIVLGVLLYGVLRLIELCLLVLSSDPGQFESYELIGSHFFNFW